MNGHLEGAGIGRPRGLRPECLIEGRSRYLTALPQKQVLKEISCLSGPPVPHLLPVDDESKTPKHVNAYRSFHGSLPVAEVMRTGPGPASCDAARLYAWVTERPMRIEGNGPRPRDVWLRAVWWGCGTTWLARVCQTCRTPSPPAFLCLFASWQLHRPSGADDAYACPR